ncbi:hypothetical protein DPMN_187020 [Dreissena polymorpha]|uniref:Uncharacterized protein n=1 Tax=Dreissena polymorpha TaxID=45954 RepID=A0A9D4DNX4_DREPO|nr:hypothetical protein DPMN_187020 [Dreissena polymorpha]
MRDPSSHTSLPSFVAVAHLLREIIATSGSYYGVTGQYGPVSVPSATLSPEAMALRRHIELGACVTHRATQVCQVSSLWHTYYERSSRLQAPIMG